MEEEASWPRDQRIGARWLLVVAPIGWLLALGYRREVATRLVDGTEPLTPGWSHWPTFLRDGATASTVILSHLGPFLVAFWILGVDRPASHWLAAGVFVGAVIALPPDIPLVLIAFATRPWMHFSAGAVVLLISLFGTVIGILPAAFMQVSLYGRFRAAFRIDRSLALIVRDRAAYWQAWRSALVATGRGLRRGPAGIFWSYLVIVYAFNGALSRVPDPLVRARFERSREFVS